MLLRLIPPALGLVLMSILAKGDRPTACFAHYQVNRPLRSNQQHSKIDHDSYMVETSTYDCVSSINQSRSSIEQALESCRYDVLLVANASVANYWITVQPQHDFGSAPNGYAILHYDGAPDKLPLGPTPQPAAMQPWSLQQLAQVCLMLPCIYLFPLCSCPTMVVP